MARNSRLILTVSIEAAHGVLPVYRCLIALSHYFSRGCKDAKRRIVQPGHIFH